MSLGRHDLLWSKNVADRITVGDSDWAALGSGRQLGIRQSSVQILEGDTRALWGNSWSLP